jgi:hypothetical protein
LGTTGTTGLAFGSAAGGTTFVLGGFTKVIVPDVGGSRGFRVVRGDGLCFAGFGFGASGLKGQVVLFVPSAPHILHGIIITI